MIQVQGNTQGKDPFYEKALAEHRELCRLLGCVQNCLAEHEAGVKAATRQLPNLLKSLYGHLQAHFQEEESGGLLEEAVSRLPRLSRQAMTLEREHAPMLEQLGRIVSWIEDPKEWLAHQEELDSRFKEFAHELRAHEAAENHLAAEAFKCEPCENGVAASGGAANSVTL